MAQEDTQETKAAVVRVKKRTPLTKSIGRWAQEIGFERIFAILLMLLGAVFGLLTYLALTDVWDTEEPGRTVRWLLLCDLSVALALSIIIARRSVLLWLSRRKGLAGAKLHARMVLMFGLIAIIPTIVVSIFSMFAVLTYTIK